VKYKNVGKSGLKVSQICLGGLTFGSQVKETEAISIIAKAYDSGINFIDTSPVYSETRSEEIIGKAVKGNRHSFVIATKWGVPLGGGGPGVTTRPNERGLSRNSIMFNVEGSLRRLQTDYIDLAYAHEPDYDTPIEETLRAFDDLVHVGKVRYIGCSNFTVWQMCQALRVSEIRNLARYVCVEPPYNLITRDIETELLPLCADEGIGVCVYDPLAGGLITGKYKPDHLPTEGRFTLGAIGKRYFDRYWSNANFEAIEQFKKLAAERSLTLPQFALAWILDNPNITSVINGINSVPRLEENILALDIKISTEEKQVCDQVWSAFRPPRKHYAVLPKT
jgi:1-deoxyxylulose-5-phosphate synthase